MGLITVEPAERVLGIDHFIKLVRHLVPGWLRPANVWCFRHALTHLPGDAPLLEIGSFCGLSTVVLLHLKQHLGVRNILFTCDPWIVPEGPEDALVAESTRLTIGDMRGMCARVFVRNVSFFSAAELPASFQMTSDEFFDAWNRRAMPDDVFGRAHALGGPFAFVYVDGSHKFSLVKRDFEHLDLLLEPGGFVLFDDSGADTGDGPSRVANEIATRPDYELIQRAPNAFFRKRTASPGGRGGTGERNVANNGLTLRARYAIVRARYSRRRCVLAPDAPILLHPRTPHSYGRDVVCKTHKKREFCIWNESSPHGVSRLLLCREFDPALPLSASLL